MEQVSPPKSSESRRSLLVKTWEEGLSLGSITFDDGNPDEFAQSWLGVPILLGEKVTGVICVQDPRVGAFTEADARLLGTLAASLGVALENARLFKAEQERVAELALINEIQQGLAAQLDFQAIIDLVGDKLREVLQTGNLGIRWYEQKTGLIHYLYEYEHGKRLFTDPKLPTPGGPWEQMSKLRLPVVYNTQAEIEKHAPVIPGTDQPTSSVSVPVVSSDRLLGTIHVENFERENAFGLVELRLLSMIAASLGTALENARLFDETQRLLEETRQRNSELAIINEIQQGLASKLDFQSIIDLVGDRISSIFSTNSAFICLYDRDTGMLNFRYFMEDGAKAEPFTDTLGQGLTSQVVENSQPLRFGSTEEMLQLGAIIEVVQAGDDQRITKSGLFVPLISSGTVTGVISVQHYGRNRYSESDLRLLSTLAASLSVALENARLFKAEQERVAELAIINEVQQGLASELDFQAIVNLVGDKLREVLQTPDLMISWYNEKTGLIHYLYTYEHGKRLVVEPMPPKPGGVFERQVKTRQPVVWRNPAEMKEISAPIEGTDASKSGVSVPVISSDRVLGDIQVENYERENAFGESELRLLTTIAASLGTALENARLFTETQRLLEETEQRNNELAIINSVQMALAAELNIQDIYDAVGDKISRNLS